MPKGDREQDAAAAVFDLDGTLVLTEQRNRVVWKRFFTSYDIELSAELLAHVTGRRGLDSLKELDELFPERDPHELLDEVLAHEAAGDLPPVVPVPGAGDFVRRLHADGVPLALVTSAQPDDVATRLLAVDLIDVFDTVVTAQDVSVGKPDPQGYRLACQRVGADPSRSVGFEDSPAGVAAVKAAGMRCVAVTTTFTRDVLAHADVVVPDLTHVSWPP
jgi:sugar-phosphatase